MKIKKIISRKDIIIPKGTVFENIDGDKTEFIHDCYDYLLALDNDTCVRIIVSSENKKYFKELKQGDYFFVCSSKDPHLKVVPFEKLKK